MKKSNKVWCSFLPRTKFDGRFLVNFTIVVQTILMASCETSKNEDGDVDVGQLSKETRIVMEEYLKSKKRGERGASTAAKKDTDKNEGAVEKEVEEAENKEEVKKFTPEPGKYKGKNESGSRVSFKLVTDDDGIKVKSMAYGFKESGISVAYLSLKQKALLGKIRDGVLSFHVPILRNFNPFNSVMSAHGGSIDIVAFKVIMETIENNNIKCTLKQSDDVESDFEASNFNTSNISFREVRGKRKLLEEYVFELEMVPEKKIKKKKKIGYVPIPDEGL